MGVVQNQPKFKKFYTHFRTYKAYTIHIYLWVGYIQFLVTLEIKPKQNKTLGWDFA